VAIAVIADPAMTVARNPRLADDRAGGAADHYANRAGDNGTGRTADHGTGRSSFTALRIRRHGKGGERSQSDRYENLAHFTLLYCPSGKRAKPQEVRSGDNLFSLTMRNAIHSTCIFIQSSPLQINPKFMLLFNSILDRLA
jgi:hypothetical protein